tara:strand:- start:1549 stop:2064 length:516 start_codon:yes stop_codon:yes gene_type:complete
MSKSIDEKIADSLNIELSDTTTEKPKSIKKKEPKSITVDPKLKEDIDQKSDYTLVRNNLKDIIVTGQSAIEGILNVASEGESPRAYEVVSQLINSVASANKDLIDLHKKFKDLKKDTNQQQSADNITNNAIYVGSTSDLQKLIKQSSEEKDVIDAEFDVVEEDKSTNGGQK